MRHVNKRTVPYKKLQARPHLCLNLCICDLWHRSLLIWTYPTTKRNKCTANKGFTTSISVLVKVQFLELFIFSHWIEPIEQCNKTFTDFFCQKLTNELTKKVIYKKSLKTTSKGSWNCSHFFSLNSSSKILPPICSPNWVTR